MNDLLIPPTNGNGNGHGLMARMESIASIHDNARMAAVTQEIQAAIIVAHKFPRDEDVCLQKIRKACSRPAFAESAQYQFPRGGSIIKGASIYFAREMARIWQNIRHGVDIISDTETHRTIEAWAWDCQTNLKVTCSDTFKKSIQRKDPKTKQTVWVTPDERDLRELTNRRAAIAKRNCILELIPADVVQDALAVADETIEKKIKEDPDRAKKSLLASFGEISVSASDLKEYLGCSLEHVKPDQLKELRQIYASIKSGDSSWSDYYRPAKDEEDKQEVPPLPTGRTQVRKPEKQDPPAKAKEESKKESKKPTQPTNDDDADRSWIPDFMDDMKTRIDEARNMAELKAIQAEYGSMKDLGMDLIDELDGLCNEKAQEGGL